MNTGLAESLDRSNVDRSLLDRQPEPQRDSTTLSPCDFDIFVREYAGRLLAVARRFLPHDEDAADAVQDALLSAFASRGKFRGNSSGLLIYWANDVYGVRIGSRELFHFFPDWFYRGLGLNHRLAEGMAWHFTLMWGFALNGLAYVVYTIVSGEWRHLVPNRNTFREAWQVISHDLHLSRVEPPRRKFNAAQ